MVSIDTVAHDIGNHGDLFEIECGDEIFLVEIAGVFCVNFIYAQKKRSFEHVAARHFKHVSVA